MTNSRKPNILFLMTDEQRFDEIGYANSAVKTPNLDALARESVVFTRAYTSNPSCVPARAAIYAGKYPSQCSAPTFVTYLPVTETTFMKYLQDAGCHTAIVGKQHFGKTDIYRGYDYEDIIDCHAPPGIISHETSQNSYHRFLAESGFTKGNELLERDGRFVCRWKAHQKYHIDDFVGEQGRKWIDEQRSTSKPWYLCISFPGPHSPIDGRGLPHERLYNVDDIDIPVTSLDDLKCKPPHYMSEHGNMGQVDQHISLQEIRETRLAYYANISLIDEKIGRIIQALKDAGEYDDTMIIFTSDHGDFMGDFNRIGKAQYTAEVLMRIPFLIKPPIRDYSGKTESSFISSIDIAATCISQAGAPIPEDMISRDISYYWDSPGDLDDRESLYMEARNIRTIRTRKWKFSYYQNRPYGELYDMESDPWEKVNLWDDGAYKDVKYELMRKLMDRLIDMGTRSKVHWNKGAPEI